ncbi:MAG: O-methyltransferase [Chitinophagales bacterium]|nr:O-methyltransferase [Chitinophagales bacterium]
MNFVSEEINAYCEAFSKPQAEVLRELERETHLKMLYPQMLSGHLQGKFLGMISAMLKPKAILEIGTFTGYSAICLASGLSDDGVMHTIEAEEELENTILRYFKKAGLEKKITLHIGKAAEVIPTLNMQFDLVFIDADKESYPTYYDLVFDKVRKGGLIIADNALWSGKVLNEKQDAETQGIHTFNQKALNDNRVENVLLPLRDGVMIVRKLV